MTSLLRRSIRDGDLWRLFALTVMFSQVAACSSRREPATIRDTTGVTFSWLCTGGEYCDVGSLPETPPVPSDCGTPNYIIMDSFRFVEVGPADVGYMGRFLACAHDDDCPFSKNQYYVCLSGLCQLDGSVGNLVMPHAAVILCLADQPRPATCHDGDFGTVSLQAQSLVSAACGMDLWDTNPTCAVPAECRQP